MPTDVYAIYELVRFATARDPATGFTDMWAGANHLYLAIAAAVAGVCIVWAFVRRPHGLEEIHVTR